MSLAGNRYMAMTKQLRQYAGRKLTRRLYRSMPWIGSVVALVTIAGAVRRKGWLGGTADTLLDFIPFVGGMKNLAEATRGRDFIRDR
jgi:putative toxin of predicted polymorphic toxin system